MSTLLINTNLTAINLYNSQVTIGSLFGDLQVTDAKLSTLSLTRVNENAVSLDSPMTLSSMELQAFKIKLN
jgi:hypothetical protein